MALSHLVRVRNRRVVYLAFLLAAGVAGAAEVNVIGLTAGKAVVVIDGGKPRTMRAGEESPEGVKLISASTESALFEINGRRRTLTIGSSISVASATGGRSVTLAADGAGHFITTGYVNGAPVRFMVDTGASLVTLSVSEAKRAGVNYLSGVRGYTVTANGRVPAYKVKLDTVKIGDVTLNNLDGVVLEGNALPIGLLGMSFLNRMEMKRDGSTMTLIKRY
ncbi:MAG: TIGR02281 family clan AA aspartic protease [Betaproteobacteria bacterium]|nr:TIGR02281 family clan AA aspartic protease [Betaproteobacteria bacterium]